MRYCYEILAWASESEERYIIEDDYDSEFRIKGHPMPSLQSIDPAGKVIYMNTFSKSLTSTIRISYMVLPPRLVGAFYQKLGFYSCTVSTFEKHINRMRLSYRRRREKVLVITRALFKPEECRIIENDSGLHLILELRTDRTEEEIRRELLKKGIRISSVADYDMRHESRYGHQFIINYSSMDLDRLEEAYRALRKACGFPVL